MTIKIDMVYNSAAGSTWSEISPAFAYVYLK